MFFLMFPSKNNWQRTHIVRFRDMQIYNYRVLAADGLLGARRARRAPAVKVEESSVAVNASNTPNAQLVQPDNSVA